MSALLHLACVFGLHARPERYPFCPRATCAGHCPRCGTSAGRIEACRRCERVGLVDKDSRCARCAHDDAWLALQGLVFFLVALLLVVVLCAGLVCLALFVKEVCT